MLEMVDLEDLPYFYIRPSFKNKKFLYIFELHKRTFKELGIPYSL